MYGKSDSSSKVEFETDRAAPRKLYRMLHVHFTLLIYNQQCKGFSGDSDLGFPHIYGSNRFIDHDVVVMTTIYKPYLRLYMSLIVRLRICCAMSCALDIADNEHP